MHLFIIKPNWKRKRLSTCNHEYWITLSSKSYNFVSAILNLLYIDLCLIIITLDHIAGCMYKRLWLYNVPFISHKLRPSLAVHISYPLTSNLLAFSHLVVCDFAMGFCQTVYSSRSFQDPENTDSLEWTRLSTSLFTSNRYLLSYAMAPWSVDDSTQSWPILRGQVIIIRKIFSPTDHVTGMVCHCARQNRPQKIRVDPAIVRETLLEKLSRTALVKGFCRERPVRLNLVSNHVQQSDYACIHLCLQTFVYIM